MARCLAIPSLIKGWHASPGDFAPVVAAGLIGMAFGSLLAGYIGDRFGRRRVLFVSIALFGAATCAIGLAPNLLVIGTLRFVAGLGIGGWPPSATTLVAEFTPKCLPRCHRRRDDRQLSAGRRRRGRPGGKASSQETYS